MAAKVQQPQYLQSRMCCGLTVVPSSVLTLVAPQMSATVPRGDQTNCSLVLRDNFCGDNMPTRSRLTEVLIKVSIR
jgi:hypothetical protein